MDFDPVQPFVKLISMKAEIQTAPRTESLECCPVCDGSNTKFFFASPDRLHGTPGEFSYHECRTCHSVLQNPMVIREDLHLCYSEEYAPYNFTQEIPEIDLYSLPAICFKQRLRRAVVDSVRGNSAGGFIGLVGRILSTLRFARERAFYGLVIDECLPKGKGPHEALDLGCGTGWFMQKLQRVGWSVEGLEWNNDAAKIARDVTGSNVWSGDFFDVDLPRGKYQLIVLNHVFEHFADPKSVLVRVHELLAEDGRVVLFFPNPHSFGAKRFGPAWFPWEVPRHLVLPSVGAMRSLAVHAGFRKARTRARAYYSEVHWARSKAYVEGRHPETDPPALGLRESVGVAAERTAAVFGFDTGWEIVSVLEK